MHNMRCFFFFSSRRRHTRWNCDWSSDVCSSDLRLVREPSGQAENTTGKGLSPLAKSTGMAITTLGVGDSANSVQDIRNDVTNWSFSTPRGVQDVTGIDKSAIERLLLLADFSVTLNGVFNAAVSHLVFRTVPSSSVNRMIAMTVNGVNLNLGTAGGGNGAVLFTDYQLTRPQTGELTWSVPGVLANGSVPTWS